ncbi:MAG TPA: sigma-70 family RNA polymerase sigma factor [Planctomycetaceae bacterium]
MALDWSRILHEHGQAVFQAAYRILGQVSDAEDTAQEVFLEACSSSQVGEVRNWGAYLRKLAVFRALDLRRRRRKLNSLESCVVPADSANPCDEAVRHELTDRVRDFVAALPEREGAVFALRYHELLSNPQIAEVLRISVGAVAAAIHKVRAKMETLLLETSTGELP